ncbi:MAG: CsbD family protein [Deltaproteobacteria bacterium]|nr:CsbD family protein [Deltaproteobacteria bacterium]
MADAGKGASWFRVHASAGPRDRVLTWAQIEAKWDRVRVCARDRFADLSDRDLERIRGCRGPLVDRVRKVYGLDLDSAETLVEEWRRSVKV